MRDNRAMSRFAVPALPRRLALVVTATLAASQGHADDYPLWELGAGLAVLSRPDYRGSDRTRTDVLPVPYLRYRGEFLRVDREGLRGLLFDTDRLELNLSVNATLGADSDDNPARAGMADLEPVAEIGPTLDLNLWRSPDGRRELAFRLPLRGAVTVESSPQFVGWVLWPNLKLDVADPPGLPGWDFDIQVGPTFGSRAYHSYFYDVGLADATPERPEYSASAGYGGSQLAMSLTRRFPRFWVGAGLRYEHLAGAAFVDSPLVMQESALSAAFAVSWIFAESSREVEAEQ